MTTPAITVCTEVIALKAEDAARVLGMSERTFRKRHTAGMVPEPVKIGTSNRWLIEDLRQWASAGCPPQSERP